MPYADKQTELSARKWRHIRAYVLAQTTACGICGKPANAVDGPLNSVDHIVPISRGGALYDLENLRGCHLRCNQSRGADARPPKVDRIITSRNW